MPTMEASYGVVVGNRFGALTEDIEDDPLEQLKILEQAAKKKKEKQEISKTTTKGEKEKEKEKGTKTAKNKSPKEAVVSPTNSQAKNTVKAQEQTDETSNRKFVPRPERGGRVARESREEGDKRPERRRLPPRDVDLTVVDTPERQESSRSEGFGRQGFNRSDENRNQGGGFAGPGRPGRGRGTRGGIVRGGKRNFDRHSGSDKTGVKSVEKREGGGAHNWGNMKDDIDEHLKEPEDVQNLSANADDTENQDPNTEPTAAVTENADETAPTEPPVEEKQMTLDEWKALQSKDVVQPTFDIRKPDDTQWKKGYYALPKKGQLDGDLDVDNDMDEHKGRHKELVNIKIMFNEPPQRGGRGIRRVGRGPRVRGGLARGERRGFKESAAPRVDDERDFPQLGTA